MDAETVKEALHGRYGDFYAQYTDLKRIGGELRGPCPLHGGDGPNFAVQPDTGEWYCHSRCQEGGDVFTFLMRQDNLTFPEALRRVADFTNVSPSPRPADAKPTIRKAAVPPALSDLADEYHRRLIADTIDAARIRCYLSAMRGLEEETLVRFRLGLVPGPPGQERISFPLSDADGQLVNIRKHLFAHTPDMSEERRRKLGKTKSHAPGLPALLYPLSALDGAADVLLVEGEADALLANQMGLPAVTGTLGAGGWRSDWTDALHGKTVTMLYDNDDAGQKGARKTAETLRQAGITVRLASYPPGVKDLTEWVTDHGAARADVQAAVAAATTPPAPPPLPASLRRKPIAERIITARQVGPPPENRPYLFGPYLNLGATHWLTGQTGIGKSTFVYNLAGALAEASELWGLQCRKQHVLYLDMESGQIGRQMKMGRLYPDREPPEDWLFATEPIRLPEELADFLVYIQAQGVTFVIFDTARRCFTVKDENDNAEVYNRVVPVLDALKRAGAAVLVLGHPPKNGATGARGAGAQEDAGDVNLTLTMHRGEVSDPDGVITLRVTKNRLLGHVPPLFLRRMGEDRFERMEAEEAASVQADSQEVPTARVRCGQDILDFLAECDNPQRHKEIVKEMMQRGYAEGTAKKAITELQNGGKIGHDLSNGYVLCEAA